ncbi:copper resistance CopC/CopD family protein [Myceligenerans xiligouense]|uniref:Copper transport protein n=1 Tax=Myceligenerans xiligouense TaxID=253184 RepID=A0A3N4Z7Z7_9MICO|nr:copper resistance protein CopC [Myceligenerans xiligouense]RPF21978.1 copper transport protein [Myceligenerans xiligouense]
MTTRIDARRGSGLAGGSWTTHAVPAGRSRRAGPGVLVRGAAALALTMLALVLGAAPATAHTKLDSAAPADGTTHDGAPAAITLTYTLPVTPLGDTVVVTGPDGTVPVEVTQQQDGVVVVATPARKLTNGDYTVDWTVAAQDGHPLQGTVRFSVTGAPPDAAAGGGATGAPADPGPTADAGGGAEGGMPHEGSAGEDAGPVGSATSTIAALLARLGNAAALWGLLLAAGGLVFAGAVLRGTDRVDIPAALAAVRWTGALILAGLAVRLAARTVIVAQGDLAAVLSPGAYGDALAGPTRWVFLLQAAGALAIVAGTYRSVAGSWLAIAGTLLAGAGHVLDGHSITGAVPWLVVATDVAHLAAAAAWVGGMVMTGLVLRRRRREGRTLDAGLLGARFSVVAGVSVLVLGFAGVVLAVSVLERPAELWETEWGLFLLAKVAVVGLVGLVGAYSHFRLVPYMERPGRTARSALRSVSQMERTARFETALLAVVVLLTAWLVAASIHG